MPWKPRTSSACASTARPKAAASRPPSGASTATSTLLAPDAGAIVHAHSPFATSLACLRRDIPPFHYMIARFGGDSCAAPATRPSARRRCPTPCCWRWPTGAPACWPTTACWCSATIWRRRSTSASNSRRSANSTGAPASSVQPVLLDAAEMATVLEKFAGYGQQA
jgi:L-fuculose-phosphate aldolase